MVRVRRASDTDSTAGEAGGSPSKGALSLRWAIRALAASTLIDGIACIAVEDDGPGIALERQARERSAGMDVRHGGRIARSISVRCRANCS